jgi:LCP family protein required for cell wall assembly
VRHSRRKFWTGLAVALLVLVVFPAAYFGLPILKFFEKTYDPQPLPSFTPGVDPTEVGQEAPTEPPETPGGPTRTPRPTSTPVDLTEVALPPGRINILVLGTDKRPGISTESARSDTLILLSVDPDWKTAGILSIPRDLEVPIGSYGLQKINAAYFYGEFNKIPGGGPALAVDTVRRFFNVPIDYYVAVNFEGFQTIIDEVGGIDVYVPEEIADDQYPGPYNDYISIYFPAGCQHLGGEKALQYARTRHADADFGRSRRQQQVIRAVRDKVLELNMLPRYPQLLDKLGDSVVTNIPPDKQWAFAQLAGQIATDSIYTAQIDNTMVTELANGNLRLRRDKARPMLDWFFSRGTAYRDLRPGTILTPTAVPTAVARALTPTPRKAATARPGTTRTAVAASPETETPIPGVTLFAPTATPPPRGNCR